MILSELRDYIKQRQQVALADIINHFDIDEETARAMLDVWITKGKIHYKKLTNNCGSSCNQCQVLATEFYLWGPKKTTEVFVQGNCQIKL